MTDEQRNDKDMAHLRAGYVPLKEYVDVQFAAVQRAVDKAETTLSVRLGGMNEFRDQLRDQASTFVSRREVESALQPIRDEIAVLRDQAGKFITQSEARLMISPLCDDIRVFRDFMSKAEGKASQSALVFTAIVAISSLIIGGVALFLGK